MKDEAGTALAAAARSVLGPLGFQRKGRSRTWVADRGWWLLVVEFQPSSWRPGGAYLNLGEQHLWIERDHLVFEEPERPLGGTTVVDLSVPGSVEDLMVASSTAVRRRLEAHGNGEAALRRIAGWKGDDLNAGIAASLLGDQPVARARLQGRIHEADLPLARSYVASLDDGTVEAVASQTIASTRAQLKLPTSHQTWSSPSQD